MTSKNIISNQIKKDLGLIDESASLIEESYVAMPKTYSLQTEFLSAKAKKSHFDLYNKYIDAVNSASAKLDVADKSEASSNGSAFRFLKSKEVFNLNAVYLHELFFANISDLDSDITMDSLAYMRLSRDFGTFDNWQNDFIATAMSARNGWAVCAYSTFLKKYINFFVDSHDQGILMGCYPVIVLDMWEHSYFKDYMDEKKTYIYAMMKEFDWEVIEERVKRADKISEALR